MGGGGDERGIEITALQSIQLATGKHNVGGRALPYVLRYVKHQLTQETDILFAPKNTLDKVLATATSSCTVLYVINISLLGLGFITQSTESAFLSLLLKNIAQIRGPGPY